MKELKIEIDLSTLSENRIDRLITELGLSKVEAKAVSKRLKNLVDTTITNQNKDFPKAVREELTNLAASILIETLKASESILKEGK